MPKKSTKDSYEELNRKLILDWLNSFDDDDDDEEDDDDI